jgi:YHS domain-containing protein
MTPFKIAFFSLITIFYTQMSTASDNIHTGYFSNKALSGYDTVAYFKKHKAIKGLKKYHVEYQGADWFFSNSENLLAFNKEPSKYTPQYGGYCAYAIANENDAGGDPELFSIHKGKLYLSYNEDIFEKWEKDKDGIIKNADINWPQAVE